MTVGQMPPPRGNPLASACYYNQPDVVKALLASGADPLARDTGGNSAIHRCIHHALHHSSNPPNMIWTCLKLLLATEQFELVAQTVVSRTSRGLTPTPPRSVLFIDALSDEQVEAMLEGDYAEHATRELQRRADGGNTAESNIKDALREWPHERSLLNCLALCGDAWEAGADILRARGPLDDDPPSVRIFLASSSNARIEE